MCFFKKSKRRNGSSSYYFRPSGRKECYFSLAGEKIALLIGKRGQTLNALQYLTQLVTNRYSKHYLNVIVDAEGYRERTK